MNKIGLYLLCALYITAGIAHLLYPGFYLGIMPLWLPWQLTLVALSGIAEILLGMLLLWYKSRRLAAWLIIAMLLVYFFVIHVPMAINFYASGNAYAWLAIVRIPVQFLLIWWAWIYTKPARF